MIFASDNWAGASDQIARALVEAARHGGPAYGADALTAAMTARFADIFEREVAVFPVATGTAANALGLSAFARPGGVVFSHAEAHVIDDEAGATEFLGGGTKVVGLPGDRGKITPDALREALKRFPEGRIHAGQPAAVSLTEVTEFGATYSPDEIAAIATVARGRGMAVHMDGARFAGAVAALDVSPADLTWRAGVDVLSFGGTKNGCIAAEAVVIFDTARARDFPFVRQRAGHAFSKGWFAAAQFDAYLKDGHWLSLARHAKAMGARLANAIERSGKARLAFPADANEVFAILPRAVDEKLRAAGVVYHPWQTRAVTVGEDEVLARLVASFQTTAEEVDAFAAVLADA